MCVHCGEVATYWYKDQAGCNGCGTICSIQSDEYLLAPATEEMAQTMEQTTGFMDGAAGTSIGTGATHTDFDLADAVTDAGLSDYLSRPVRIRSFTWALSDPRGLVNDFDPWRLFFSDSSIRGKLNNFAFIRCNLKLKFLVNASPFYYGSIRACYQPMPNFKASTIVGGAQGTETNPELIPYSQQPGVWLKPAHSEGAEFTLPFFWPRSFLRVQRAQDFTDMGKVRMMIYNQLRSANGVSGTGVTVQVYAWAEDVVLAGPSVGLALQADEYGVGPVSGPASTLARIAGKLRSVPVIGKFATATEIGAKAVSGIATLFGFTNVPVISDVMPYNQSAFPPIASSQIGFPVQKLTLDPKNELSIDPSIAGLSSKDELAIREFATRQSYLTSASWTTATAVDTALFTSKVTPSLAFGNTTQNSRNYMTPMSLCSLLMRSWRGDIIFTFRFISSPFHKGRVRISFDPYGTAVQNTQDTGPMVYNKIVDLGAETEVDFRIPYQQALAWCYNYTSVSDNLWTTSAAPAITYTDTFDNGLVSVKVLSTLSAPTATSTVEMQVFVRGAENIEFANPASINPYYTPFQLQSEEYVETCKGVEADNGKSMQPIESLRTRVNFGENVGSLRTLMRRMNLVDHEFIGTALVGLGNFTVIRTRFPPYYGYDPAGTSLANKVIGVGTANANYSFTLPWHFISNCFVGQRGSFNWTYAMPKGSSWNAARVSRITYTYPGGSSQYVATPATTASAWSRALTYNSAPTTGGSAIVTTNINGGLTFSVPNYSAFKFQSTDPQNATSPDGTSGARYDGSVFEGVAVEMPAFPGNLPANTAITRYAGIGTDYTLLFFLNCPVLYSLPESVFLPP